MRPDKTEVYKDSAGEWRWRRIAPNGEIIADSAESYTRKADCEKAATRVFGAVDEAQHLLRQSSRPPQTPSATIPVTNPPGPSSTYNR